MWSMVSWLPGCRNSRTGHPPAGLVLILSLWSSPVLGPSCMLVAHSIAIMLNYSGHKGIVSWVGFQAKSEALLVLWIFRGSTKMETSCNSDHHQPTEAFRLHNIQNFWLGYKNVLKSTLNNWQSISPLMEVKHFKTVRSSPLDCSAIWM